jgi:membrane-bound metal-dependent hydrolase YbcI (DUF457 family)
MDPLTQAAAALTLSRLSRSRILSRPVILFLIAAMAPDLDLLSSWLGAEPYLRFHRTLLHSIPDAVLLAILIAFIGWATQRRQTGSAGRIKFLKALAICLCGIAAHLLLDLCDPVGVQLFWPLRLGWRSWALTTTLDPWILLALVVGLALGGLFRIASEEIGDHSKTFTWPRRWAVIALLAVAGWFITRSALHARAMQLLSANTYNDLPAQAVGAFPSAVTPLDWRGIVSARDFIAEIDVPLRPVGAFDPGAGLPHPKPQPSRALDVALNTPLAREFLRYARFPLANEQLPESATTNPAPDAHITIQVRDLRFAQADRGADNLILIVELDAKLNVVREEVDFAHARH